MLFGFIKWMRRVLPRGQMVAFAVLTIGLVECVELFCLLCFGNANPDFFRSFRFVQLVTMAFLYGVYRIIGFHPAANPDYRRWLELTPW